MAKFSPRGQGKINISTDNKSCFESASHKSRLFSFHSEAVYLVISFIARLWKACHPSTLLPLESWTAGEQLGPLLIFKLDAALQ